MGDFDGFIFGMFITLVFFFAFWVTTNIVNTTTDGKYYIKTHGTYYQLTQKEPVNITTSLK